VSPSIILYAKTAKHVLSVTLQAGIQLDFSETLALHADRYDFVLVKLHTRPIRPKPYALSEPMTAIRHNAGMAALGALPNVAIPAGNAKTSAPTIHLTRLKTSARIVETPSPLLLLLLLLSSEEATADDLSNDDADDDVVLLGKTDKDDDDECKVFLLPMMGRMAVVGVQCQGTLGTATQAVVAVVDMQKSVVIDHKTRRDAEIIIVFVVVVVVVVFAVNNCAIVCRINDIERVVVVLFSAVRGLISTCL
jgi:hypothetical protein